ncbi:MAG TPA: hypothetical protein VGC13_02830 [Longimicrobium sp.]|jgi:hypothetical protein|uniref:hypothetical protein n=1 Tax=Longimicrobium sp. TaxID=2029185 RepID=UPI002EDA0578
MKLRIMLLTAAVALLAPGGARTASAQAQPDPDGLAAAVGAIVADSVLPRLGGCDPVYIRTPETPFDSAVAALLRTEPDTRAFGASRPEAYEWVGTRGYTLQGDTASVLVEVGARTPPNGGIDTYIEENRYLFIRAGGGWRFVRREFVRGMDLGPVRG